MDFFTVPPPPTPFLCSPLSSCNLLLSDFMYIITCGRNNGLQQLHAVLTQVHNMVELPGTSMPILRPLHQHFIINPAKIEKKAFAEEQTK